MEKLNELIGFYEMTGDEPELLVMLLELRRHRLDNWKQRAEAAEVECARLDQESQNLSNQLGCCDRERRSVLAKLANLEKQEPYLIPNLEHFISFWKKFQSGNMKPGENEISHTLWFLEELAQTDLFTRPAPAADLAELVPEEMPRSVVESLGWRSEKKDGLECYHGENLRRAYGSIRAAILRNIEDAK